MYALHTLYGTYKNEENVQPSWRILPIQYMYKTFPQKLKKTFIYNFYIPNSEKNIHDHNKKFYLSGHNIHHTIMEK